MKSQNILNNKIIIHTFLEIFYRGLNANNKAIGDTVTVVAFMRLHWDQAFKILDQITKTKQGWHIHDVEVTAGTYMITTCTKQRYLDDLIAREVAQLRIKLNLFTKQFAVVDTKNVNVVRSQGKEPRNDNSNFDQEFKYLNNQVTGKA